MPTNENCTACKEFYVKLVVCSKSLGGRDSSSRVNHILKRVQCDTLATEFNIHGQWSNKKPFYKLFLQKFIVDSIKSTHGGVTDKDIENCIKNWLKHRKKEKLKNKRVHKYIDKKIKQCA